MVPVSRPLTRPLPVPTVATAVLLLLQVPPPEPSVNAVDDPAQTFRLPVIPPGTVLTVTVVVVIQPVDSVYVIVDVPGVPPVTKPEADPIVATTVLLLIHVPPPASLKVVDRPEHTDVVPVIADGNGLTVATFVTLHPPASV